MVFLDLQMPIMDGNEAVILMREIEAKQMRNKSQIVALTADVYGNERESLIKLGFDEKLTKPIEKEIILTNFWYPKEKDCCLNRSFRWSSID